MHHSLKLYSRYREWFLRCYIFMAKWTRLPLIGPVVRMVGNRFGRNTQGAYLLTATEAEAIVDASERVALGPCTCRRVFKHCESPSHAEIMVGLSQDVIFGQRPHDYRDISKAEAKHLLQDCHRRGLIHTIVRCRHDFYAICNCCPCCCVPLRLSKKYGIGRALTRQPDIVGVFRKHLAEHRA